METAFEQILLHSNKTRMLSYMSRHPRSFNEALNLVLSNKQPYAWRAAWLLESVMKDNDARVRKHLKKLVSLVKVLQASPSGQQRELLKLIQRMEIPTALEGNLFDYCLSAWEDVKKQPSVRYNALLILQKIASKHPDLQRELSHLSQPQYLETLSPAIRKSANKLLTNISIS